MNFVFLLLFCLLFSCSHNSKAPVVPEIKPKTVHKPLRQMSEPKLVNLVSDSMVIVYSEPRESTATILGNLIFKTEDNKFQPTFVSLKNKFVKFTPDFYAGYCKGTDRNLALNNVYEEKNGYSNIGPGPWGSIGWVKNQSYKINDPDLPIVLTYKEYKDIEFGPELPGKFMISLTEEVEGNEVSSQQMMTFEDMIDPKTGKLVFSPDCSKSKSKKETIAESDEEVINQLPEPMFVDLIPNDFQLGSETFAECNIHDPNIDDKICDVVKKKCQFDGVIADPDDKVSIYSDFRVNELYLDVPWLDRLAKAPRVSGNLFILNGATSFKSASIIAAGTNYSSQIYFSNFVIDLTSKKPVLLKSPSFYRKVIFKVYEKANTESVIANLKIGEVDLGDYSKVLLFTPGNYKIDIKANRVVPENYRAQFKVPTTNSKEPLIVPIYLDRLKTASNFSDYKVEITNRFEFRVWNNLDYEDRSELINFEMTGVTKSGVKNITPFISKNDAHLRVSNEEDFKSLLKDGPLLLKINGTCGEAKAKEQFREIPVYANADKENLIGHIKVVSNGSKTLKYSYLSKDKLESDFAPNFANMYCESRKKIISSHQVFKDANGFSDLGAGPWGERGWVELFPFSLSTSNYEFDLHNIVQGQFTLLWNGKYRITGDEFSEEGDRSSGSSIEVSPDEIMDSEGRFSLSLSCNEIGC